jgi:hypothetical protein
MLFSGLVGDPQDKIAILDAVPCRHPHRRDHEMDRVMTREAMKAEGLELLARYRGGEMPTPITYRTVPIGGGLV